MKPEDFKRFGFWEVTTEADIEGRRTKHLGTHEGNIDEIALSLPSSAGWKYTFDLIKKPDLTNRKREKANISINGINKSRLVKLMNEELKNAGADSYVIESNLYETVELKIAPRPNSDHIMMAQRLKDAGFNPQEVINALNKGKS